MRRHTRHMAARRSCANESSPPQTEGCIFGSYSQMSRRRTSSSSSPARHRAAGGAQAAICEQRRAMRRVSRGSGERCITHRKCSREPPLSADQLRVARLKQPGQNGTHGSQGARELRPDCSTGRARAPATSRRACRAALTCRVPTASHSLRPATRRYGAVPSRIQREQGCCATLRPWGGDVVPACARDT